MHAKFDYNLLRIKQVSNNCCLKNFKKTIHAFCRAHHCFKAIVSLISGFICKTLFFDNTSVRTLYTETCALFSSTTGCSSSLNNSIFKTKTTISISLQINFTPVLTISAHTVKYTAVLLWSMILTYCLRKLFFVSLLVTVMTSPFQQTIATMS